MPEIAREALEFAVRAAGAGEDGEMTVRRARAFYEFLRAPAGASVQTTTDASKSYSGLGSSCGASALNGVGPRL